MERSQPKQETLGDQYRELKQKALQEIRDSGGEFAVDADRAFDDHLAIVDFRLSTNEEWATDDAIQYLEFSGMSKPTATKLLLVWLKIHRDSGDAMRQLH